MLLRQGYGFIKVLLSNNPLVVCHLHLVWQLGIALIHHYKEGLPRDHRPC
mgnify:CR=1 FL=1